MVRYKKKQIGVSCSLTAEEIANQSIEDLIDKGKRFSLAQTISIEDDEECEDYDYVD